ncbi:hypothetical protein Poli38472_008753 [Pythium oligandrum]|uniref:EF-hand domain-containing protein n=1 Tax=Pythium oligandrum TaxID=41045 RepID=A0A8K1C478_PYTOL|nr:hypothetical protein Poli38472_008753 [Pythium oligandrum]|eukprot:TMW56105.1 hypothetical protein Poli38472_008753 [Pythium oligandrum]
MAVEEPSGIKTDERPTEEPKPVKKKKKNKPQDSTEATQPKKTKKKKAPSVQIAVEPPSPIVSLPKEAQDQSSAWSTNLGGYSTGYYRVLLETQRVEALCRSLTLRYRDIAALRSAFDNEDWDRTGYLTVDEFIHLLKEEKRPLTTGVFEHCGLGKRAKRLNFDEFVLCIVTIASLSRRELIHYAFTLFDKDESGIMDAKELAEFCGNLKNKGFFFQGNVDIAQKKLTELAPTNQAKRTNGMGNASAGDGLVDFEDLAEGSTHFHAAFYPILQFQRKFQTVALGEAFWDQIIFRKAQVERIVHYMRLHDGHLPPLTIRERARALGASALFVITGGMISPSDVYTLRKAAVAKYAEEVHQVKQQVAARELAEAEAEAAEESKNEQAQQP